MGVKKSGMVFEKRFSDWFDIEEDSHRAAWSHFKRLRVLPAAFVPDDIWLDPHWEEKVRLKLGAIEETL